MDTTCSQVTVLSEQQVKETIQSQPQQIPEEEVPVIDFQLYFERREGWEAECKKVADSLHRFGIIVCRDPRVNHQDNETYIDMIEEYFEKVGEASYRDEELVDCRPELSYQTGVTPSSIERARDHQKVVEGLPAEDRPMSKFPPELDAKWRYFWPIGDRPPELENDIPKVIPADFPEWETKMDTWGSQMVNGAFAAAEMAAVGMGLNANTFTSRMEQGPHLLSPTASDLQKFPVGTAFAGFHYDLNFLTIHGKSRYPGLFIWLRNWKKMACKIPNGCLLMQAGIMFEKLTGGHVLAGFHEVMYTEATKAALERVKQEVKETGKKRVLWRISSTLFSHIRYNVDLTPLKELDHLYDPKEAAIRYPSMTAHETLIQELTAINLVPKQSYADQK